MEDKKALENAFEAIEDHNSVEERTSLIVVPPTEIAVNSLTVTSSFICGQYLLAISVFDTDLIMSQVKGNHRHLANNIFGTTTKQFVEVEKVFRYGIFSKHLFFEKCS